MSVSPGGNRTVRHYIKRVEGVWDCHDCGRKNIPGLTLECPDCHNPRNMTLTPDERPHLPEGRSVQELGELPPGGQPNWNCGYCGRENLASAEKCAGCDRPRDEDDTFNRRIRYVPGGSAVFRPEDDVLNDEFDRAQSEVDHPGEPLRRDDVTVGLPTAYTTSHSTGVVDYPPEAHKLLWRILLPAIVATILLVCLVSGGVHYASAKVTDQVIVSQLAWRTEVPVEEYRTLQQEGWSYPADARITDSRREVRSYNQVLVGYDTETYYDTESRYVGTETDTECSTGGYVDNGDGSFSVEQTCYDVPHPVYEDVLVAKTRQVPRYRQDPVYDTKYFYEIDRWVSASPLISSGSSEDTVTYAVLPLLTQYPMRISGNGVETCTVKLMRGSSPIDQTLNCDIWSRLHEGQTLTATFRKHGGGLVSVDWPRRLS